MSFTYTLEQLTQAVLAFRDSLPEDNEFRRDLRDIKALRFDNVTPGLLHISFSDEKCPDIYRRVTFPTEKSLDDIAKEIVLYPIYVMIFGFDLQLTPRLVHQYKIVDKFQTDHINTMYERVIVVNLNQKDAEDFYNFLVMTYWKVHNPDNYYLQYFVSTVAGQLQKRGSNLYDLLHFAEKAFIMDPTMLESTQTHARTSEQFREKLNVGLAKMFPCDFLLTDDNKKELMEWKRGSQFPGLPPGKDILSQIEEISKKVIGMIMVLVISKLLPGVCSSESAAQGMLREIQQIIG